MINYIGNYKKMNTDFVPPQKNILESKANVIFLNLRNWEIKILSNL